jgi:hypothetical protein
VIARRPGRPPLCPEETLRRVVIERLQGRSFGQIARSLNADGVPTGTGGLWQRAGVYQTFTSLRARELIEAWGEAAPRAPLPSSAISPPAPQSLRSER